MNTTSSAPARRSNARRGATWLALAAPLLLAAALAAIPAFEGGAWARTNPCAASVEEARRHMDHGLELFDRKRFVEAAAEFDAAYAAEPYSAFLCNAAMAYQEALDFPHAIERYRSFLAAEPNPPDLARIERMVAWLEAQRAAHDRAAEAGADTDASPESDGGGAADAGAPEERPPTMDMSRGIRSQVVIESEPPGAPLVVYARGPGAPPFVDNTDNAGWEKVVVGAKTPHDVALGVGDYHIVIDSFQDYKRSETDLSLSAGRVYTFKANLSQGKFLGFLRVSSPVEGAVIYLDDPPPHAKGAWGRTPRADMLASGPHEVWIEAAGYQPFHQTVTVERGRSVELGAVLARVPYGFLIVDGNADEMEIKIDGVLLGTYAAVGDPVRLQLPAGGHRVELDAHGRKPYVGVIEIPRGQEIAVHGRLSFTPPRINALISGTLAIGAGIGAGVLFSQPSYKLTALNAAGLPTYATADTQPWMKICGGVAAGVAGLLTAATVFNLVSDPNPGSRMKIDKPTELDGPRASGKACAVARLPDVAPLIGPRGGGLLLSGTF